VWSSSTTRIFHLQHKAVPPDVDVRCVTDGQSAMKMSCDPSVTQPHIAAGADGIVCVTEITALRSLAVCSIVKQ
jgi:hypothetical protein